MEITLDYLKRNCVKIHSFGLGFIQIKLNDKERVHVYCPEVVVTTDEEEIHDHRYGFTSKIIKGSLTNIIYGLDMSKDTHLISFESCDPNRPVHNTEKIPCGIKEILAFTVNEGSVYSLDKDTLHRVKADRCITYLIRETPSKDVARVVSEKNKKLVCPFSVNKDEETLWKLVERELCS